MYDYCQDRRPILSTFHYHFILAQVFICAKEVTNFLRKSILADPKAKMSNSLGLYQILHHTTSELFVVAPYRLVIREHTKFYNDLAARQSENDAIRSRKVAHYLTIYASCSV